jgi:hypothetical protein
MNAASRLCAWAMAWKSPVKCRLMSSIGTTCAWPPPVAPPLRPNTGPIEGWRSASTARWPSRAGRRPGPPAVVVLPSPAGVGVMAVTRISRPSGAGQRAQAGKCQLGHVVAVGPQRRGVDAELLARQLGNGARRGAAGDVQVVLGHEGCSCGAGMGSARWTPSCRHAAPQRRPVWRMPRPGWPRRRAPHPLPGIARPRAVAIRRGLAPARRLRSSAAVRPPRPGSPPRAGLTCGAAAADRCAGSRWHLAPVGCAPAASFFVAIQ